MSLCFDEGASSLGVKSVLLTNTGALVGCDPPPPEDGHFAHIIWALGVFNVAILGDEPLDRCSAVRHRQPSPRHNSSGCPAGVQNPSSTVQAEHDANGARSRSCQLTLSCLLACFACSESATLGCYRTVRGY